MENIKYDIWMYDSEIKEPEKKSRLKPMPTMFLIAGVVLFIVALLVEESEIKINLMVLSIGLGLFGVICLLFPTSKKNVIYDEIIFAYIYSSTGILYRLDMWSEQFLSRTGLQIYARQIATRTGTLKQIKTQLINNDSRKKIVASVKKNNLINKLIEEGKFEDIAQPIQYVSGIKENKNNIRLFYSYFRNKKQINTSFVVRDIIENYETLAKCLKEYHHIKAECCAKCGNSMHKGKCVACGEEIGIKMPNKISYIIWTVIFLMAGVFGFWFNANANNLDGLLSVTIVLASFYSICYAIYKFIKMNESVR